MGRIPFSQGLFGGYPPPALPELVIRNSNILEFMEKNSKDIPMSLREIMVNQKIEGDYKLVSGPEDSPHTLTRGGLYVATNSGGAGYGDSIEREPQAVVDDVKSGIISNRTVQNIYHVAYDPETWTVDYEKTEELRTREMKNRKQRGRPYHEFIKEWETKKPPEKFLEYFGSWPDAKKVREIIRV
jgi:acetophenone carboxylase